MTTPTVARVVPSPETAPATAAADPSPLGSLVVAPATHALRSCLTAQATASSRTALQRIIGASPLSTDSRQLFQTAMRHLDLGERLELLDASWHIIESPSAQLGPVPASYLVVGPAGVVSVSSGNDVTADAASLARSTAYRTALSRALQADVPVIALHVGRASAPDVADLIAVHAGDLVHVITELAPALTSAQSASLTRLVSEAADNAERPSPDEHVAFAQLEATVSAARRTRIRWCAALGSLTMVAAIIGIATLF